MSLWRLCTLSVALILVANCEVWSRDGDNINLSRSDLADVTIVAQPRAASRSTLVNYASRASFDAAFSGLVEEDFEEGQVASGTTVSFAPPLNSSTNNGVFARGDIPSGLEIVTVPNTEDLVLVGRNVNGTPSKCMAVYGGGTVLEMVFSDSVKCLAMDVRSFTGASVVTIRLYTRLGALIDSQTVTTDPSGAFFASTPAPISRPFSWRVPQAPYPRWTTSPSAMTSRGWVIWT